jgi:hypothetical protein
VRQSLVGSRWLSIADEQMKRLLLLLLLFQAPMRSSDAALRLTEGEQAALFVIREEVADYALEVRDDVCVEFGQESDLQSANLIAALREKGLRFHDGSWCNRGPRGVTIFIGEPQGAHNSSGTYEFVTEVSDSDPIRLRGDHLATLLRRSKYVVVCKGGSEPALNSYQVLCCEKGTRKSKVAPH